MKLFQGGTPKEEQPKPPRKMGDKVTEEVATKALQRSRRMSGEMLGEWADTSVMDLHRALDEHRFQGGPAEEVERCLQVAIAACRELLDRGSRGST